ALDPRSRARPRRHRRTTGLDRRPADHGARDDRAGAADVALQQIQSGKGTRPDAAAAVREDAEVWAGIELSAIGYQLSAISPRPWSFCSLSMTAESSELRADG